MRIVLEDYDKDKHGYQDDCDYVIDYEHTWEGAFTGSELLADQIAEMMGYDFEHHRHVLNDNYSRLYLCHA